MVEKGSLVVLIIIIGAHLIEDREISGLSEICGSSCDEPQRIIVESASYSHVAALGKRLVLMVCAAVRELSVCDIDDSLTSTLRDEVYESEKILT